MKKVLAILLAAMMLLSLAACGNNDDNPSGSENNPGTSQSDNQGGTENQGGENNSSPSTQGTTEPEELSVPEVLAKYGFTEEIVKPDETVLNVTAEKRYTGDYKVTFEVDAEYPNGYTYMEKIFGAIKSISDDGKVYNLTEEFLNGTAEGITLDDVSVYQNRFTLCYVHDGVQMQVETSIVSIPSGQVVLSFSAND